MSGLRLKGVRAIGLLNNWEVFGQERGCIEWFNAMRREGAYVTVGVTNMQSGGPLKELLLKQGFDTFEVPYGCQWSKKFFMRDPGLIATNLVSIIKCSRILNRMIDRVSATHLLLGNPLIFSFIAPALWFKREVRLIYRVGDEPPHDSRPNLWIWRRCFSKAKAVVANSEFVRSSIASCVGPNEKVNLIYNTASIAERSKAISFVQRESKRVLFVGQISSHKGVDLLVAAAIQICKGDPEYHFDLLGGSLYTQPLEETLRRLVRESGLSDRIVFHGHVSDPTEFYRKSSVLVVPSVFEEPAANVVLEAKRLGLPAIVFPSGGLPELLTNKQTGVVCSEKTVEALQREIIAFCGDLTEQSPMESQCIRESESRFSQARFDEQWSQVIAATL